MICHKMFLIKFIMLMLLLKKQMVNQSISGVLAWILLLEILQMAKSYLVKLNVKMDGLKQLICKLAGEMHTKEAVNILRLVS